MENIKLFELVETVDNENYFVKVFESSFYNLNIIRNKEFEYKRFEISRNGSQFAVPQIYIGDGDSNFKIEVQTTSYGALNEDEFLQFIKTQQQVLTYIEEIKFLIENE